MKRSYEIDMCNGPLLGKILQFSIPLICSGILQLLFNAADIVVVGQFTGSDALAAVGSTSALNNLIVNVFLGFSIGCSIMTARYYGAQKWKDVHEVVHTSMLVSMICGPAFAGGHGYAGKCSGPGGALYADHFRRNAGSDGI